MVCSQVVFGMVARADRNVTPEDVAHSEQPDLFQPELYFNREISAIVFIRRVFEEAQAERHPLLDRLRFLGFVSAQIDDFLTVRYAGLQDQEIAQVKDVAPDGMLPGQQLEILRVLLSNLLHEQQAYFRGKLLPQLDQAGIHILDYTQLNRAQRESAARYFRDEIFPVLTPLGVDPGHPFPHISSRSLNLAVSLRDPVAGELFARVKVPSSLRRLVPVPAASRSGKRQAGESLPEQAFVWVEQVIAAHLDQLFPGVEVVAAYPFRVLRDADFDIQIDEAGDLLVTVEQGLRKRRFGSVVCMMIQSEMPAPIREVLTENLQIAPEDVLEMPSPLAIGEVADLTELNRPDLKSPPLVPRVPNELRLGQDPFSAIQHGDLLLHHPYDSFSSVAEFIEAAARDPQVVAIKQTLYRVGKNSPIVDALLEANQQGKQVAVMVELKARFDEENNIEWARRLEREGVHVIYGQVDMKTHAKVAMVVRREGTGLRRYVHIGTGNYNAATARVYEDLALLTCRPEIGEDASNLFNAITGFARGISYKKLLVAPETLRSGLMERIEREIEQQKAGGHGHIIFKMNALVDPAFVRALYRASQAGVQVDLIVRGMCCLRPGLPGVSDHIRVISIVSRFLEHSRIYYFANGGLADDELLIGSADLMQRNLDHRIEVLVPIEDRALRGHIRDVTLPAYFRDTANARLLQANGEYVSIVPPAGTPPFDVQQWLSQQAGA